MTNQITATEARNRFMAGYQVELSAVVNGEAFSSHVGYTVATRLALLMERNEVPRPTTTQWAAEVAEFRTWAGVNAGAAIEYYAA